MEPQIHLLQGDVRNLCRRLKPNSIDAVITDLPFPRVFHPLWSDVARESARVLKPGAPFLTYSGHYGLPGLLNRLSEHLEYFWLGNMVHSRPVYRSELGIYTLGKPFLVFYKPPGFRPREPIHDVIAGSGREKQFHPWQQPLEESRKFIRCLTKPGDWILDPCCGSGTTLLAARLEGRNAVGFEIDPQAYRSAYKRLNTKR